MMLTIFFVKAQRKYMLKNYIQTHKQFAYTFLVNKFSLK